MPDQTQPNGRGRIAILDYARILIADRPAIPRRDYLLAMLSGLLLALSFPQPGWHFLAWVAFVPLLLAVSKKDPRKAFRLGFISGLTSYAIILYWVNIAITTYGKLPWAVSITLFVILTSYLALYTGAAMYLIRRGEERGITPLLTFPMVWTGLEYLRSFALTGLPWANLGQSQYKLVQLIQIADLTGVYGISFLVAMANVIAYRLMGGASRKSPKGYPAKSCALFIILLVAVLYYGHQALQRPDSSATMNVALVQGNIEQDVKWEPTFQNATVSIYERLSRQAASSGSDLIVWPESAAPFFFQDELTYASRITRLASDLKSSMVIGSIAHEKRQGRTTYLNSAFLLGPDGATIGRSDKIHLVPFGEYVPLAKFFPFIHKLVAGIGDYSPGIAATAFETGKGKIGVLICFEGIFPELARAYVRAGSSLLVSITNDAWYKRSSAPYQHLAITAFRAVENRTPLVRAANTGITAIVDTKGRITATTRIFQEATLNGTVRLGSGGSFYTRHGDIFALSCLALTTVMTALLMIKKRH